MKNIKVYSKQNELISDENYYENESDFINHIVSTNYFGKPERWTLKKELQEDGSYLFPGEVYEEEDVLEEADIPSFPGSSDVKHWVKLRAEYTIEITDVTEELGKKNCKDTAKKLIAELDWVNDTETTPLLSNRDDFIAYRSLLRALIINPVVNPTWPQRPEEEWE